METHTDIFIRDNFEDRGTTPSTGILCNSPDIIPYQENILKFDYAIKTYNGPDIGKAVINEGVNNIYIRAKNISTDQDSGEVSLYYADASLFLNPPTWKKIASPDGKSSLQFYNSQGNTLISPNEIAIASPAFLLQHLVPGPHYCFIAIVQTSKHKTPFPPKFNTNSEFTKWVQDNHSVAWRNMVYVSNTMNNFTQTLTFGNINSDLAEFFFHIEGQGFEPGLHVKVQCTDIRCSFSKEYVLPEPDPETGTQDIFFNHTVPSNFFGNLIVSTNSKSKFQVDARFTMSYYQYANELNKLDVEVSKPFNFKKTSNSSTTNQIKLFKIGEFTIGITDKNEKIDR